MVPSLCAVTGFSIFMASRTTTRSPAATVSPSATATLMMVPCIGAVTASLEVCGEPLPCRLRVGPGAPRHCPAAEGEVAGQRHLQAAAADLDDHGLPWRGLLGSAVAWNGATVLSHSVSIHRVCTVNPCSSRR